MNTDYICKSIAKLLRKTLIYNYHTYKVSSCLSAPLIKVVSAIGLRHSRYRQLGGEHASSSAADDRVDPVARRPRMPGWTIRYSFYTI